MSSFKSPSDFKGGRNLEWALRSYSDPVLLAQLAETEAAITPLIKSLGFEALLQGISPSGVRRKLEEEFVAKLRSAELIATGALEPKTLFPSFGSFPIERKLISPVQWFTLEPDFNDSSATTDGEKKIFDVLVFERSKLIGEADPVATLPVQPRVDAPLPPAPEPKTAVASSDFSEVVIDGQTLTFGPKQARALRVLYEATVAGKPWLTKNELLERSGSQLVSVKEAFRAKEWHLLIEEGQFEDGRKGHFRLRADISVSIPDRQTS